MTMNISVVRQILEWNEDKSGEIAALLREKNVFMINLMGSPGAGKTSLIAALSEKLSGEYRIGVIEGDIAGKIDAERIESLGLPVVQLNTDGACHIEAMSIEASLSHLDLGALDVLIVENIGNLVCPAEFDLGEDMRLAILSVPEGDDKIEKYPLLFSRAHALVLSKSDMLPYFEFDRTRVEGSLRAINPHAKVFPVNSKSGDGIDALCAFVCEKIDQKIGKRGAR